jgi:hypothetical protein
MRLFRQRRLFSLAACFIWGNSEWLAPRFSICWMSILLSTLYPNKEAREGERCLFNESGLRPWLLDLISAGSMPSTLT